MAEQTRTGSSTALAPEPRGLVSLGGQALPLQGVSLSVEVAGAFAETVVTQRYRNPHDEPLEVLYTMPLPVDGAVVAYTIRLGERVVAGEVRPRDEAKAEYRRALSEGRLAGLFEEERGDTFSQQLGNLPPRSDAEVEIRVVQRLAFLPHAGEQPAQWEYRFPTVVGVRYMGAEGRTPDADTLEPERADAHGTGVSLDFVITCPGRDLQPVTPARLDRDVVVRWPATLDDTAADLRVGGGLPGDDGRYGVLTLTPPRTPTAHHARDVIILIDASGSMHGEPLAAATTIAGRVLETLDEGDRFEILAFASRVERLTRGARPAQPASVERALKSLAQLQAGGATEMADAIVAALAPLSPDSQRQVILITDGYIGFEEEVIRQVARRAAGNVRVHTVGVGAAPCRSLTQGVARAGGGVEVLASTLAESAAAAANLVAACARPQVTDLRIDGSAVVKVAQQRVVDLLADRPSVVALELSPEGGALRITGRQAGGGAYEHVVTVPAAGGEQQGARQQGPAGIPLGAVFGREALLDLEAGVVAASADEIQALGMRHRIVTSQTSMVAISEEPAVDPGDPTRRERLPVELPHGVSAEGVGYADAVVCAAVQSAPRAAPRVSKAKVRRRFAAREQMLFDGADASRSQQSQPDSVARGYDLFDEADEEILFAPPEPESEAPWLRVTGRRLTRTGDVLVLEVDVGAGGWDLPGEPCTMVAFLGGDEFPLLLVGDRSTRPGPVQPGTVVRIAVRVPADFPEGAFLLRWDDELGLPVVITIEVA